MCHCRVIDQPITDTSATHPLHIFVSWKRLKIGIQSPPCHVHHVDTSWAPTANATHGMRQQISRNAFGHCMVKVFNGKTWWLASYPSSGIHVEWSCSMPALLMNYWTLWQDVNRMFSWAKNAIPSSLQQGPKMRSTTLGPREYDGRWRLTNAFVRSWREGFGWQYMAVVLLAAS